MIKKILLLSVVVVLFAVEGCVPTKQIGVERTISADRLLKRIEANRRKVKSFSAVGSIDIKSSEISGKSTFEVKIKRPDSVMVALYGPFGIDLARITISNKDFLFFDVINNKIYKGKMRPGVLKDVLKIDIQFEELINLLTGSVNLTEKLSFQQEAKQISGDNYLIEINDQRISTDYLYTVNTQDLSVNEYNVMLSSKKVFEAKYSDFYKYDDITVARAIRVDDIQRNQKINIDYKKIELNKEIGVLKIDIPDDAQIIDW